MGAQLDRNLLITDQVALVAFEEVPGTTHAEYLCKFAYKGYTWIIQIVELGKGCYKVKSDCDTKLFDISLYFFTKVITEFKQANKLTLLNPKT